MAQAYGSVAHPVDLGPFSRITEVHWATTFIAGQVQLRLDVTTGGETAEGPGPAFIEPFSFASVTEAAMSYVGGVPIAAWQQWSGTSWSALPDHLSSSGAPPPPDYSYPLWQWQGIDAFGCKAPFFSFAAGALGAVLKPTVPGRPAMHFTDAKANEIILKMQGFAAGGPYPSPFAGVGSMWRTADVLTDFSPVIQDAETASFSAAGITTTFNGKPFDAVGTRVVEPSGGDARGELWILFKKRKQEVTP
ncbi:hypothetical protein [Mesorhizobium sp.]|uniref:hypothetical protein n=1 Tax=Mesorhizobium sp. TaxID=1871066 RepID=UPI000FE56566|nr:hypothetical protein [Mesorhizobium sp.]RWE03847.1 MAG: hypothetical protein EOS40_01650 [Mesorhizobium sp.]